MVTKEQAMTCSEFHYGNCTRHVGPRGGVRECVEQWRANGKCQTWVTRPDDFRLPIKYGLKQYSEIAPYNAKDFHVAAECPLVLNPLLPKIRRTMLDWGYWEGQLVKTPCGVGTVKATNRDLGILVAIPDMGEPMWSKPENTSPCD